MIKNKLIVFLNKNSMLRFKNFKSTIVQLFDTAKYDVELVGHKLIFTFSKTGSKSLYYQQIGINSFFKTWEEKEFFATRKNAAYRAIKMGNKLIINLKVRLWHYDI